MAIGPVGGPPPGPWYRRYWGYSNRPYTGCGCLWLILVIIIVWWIIAAFFYTPARFNWW
jgi:high-affinity Fe2+/Pb2+ permease